MLYIHPANASIAALRACVPLTAIFAPKICGKVARIYSDNAQWYEKISYIAPHGLRIGSRTRPLNLSGLLLFWHSRAFQ